MSYGCKKEINDKRDYRMKIVSSSYLPEEFQLEMPEVKNQGRVNSCVAHSLSTFLEEYYKEDNKKFSVGFIYGYRPFNYYQGEGMYPREALKTLQKIGDVENGNFPYNIEIPEVKEKVDGEMRALESLASNYRIESYARLYTKKEIKECLYSGCPVPISIPVYNNLKVNKDGVIEMPSGEVEGYHMVILYGWNKTGFLLQNSWGKYWGKEGCAILPYDYKIDSAWAISTETNNIQTHQLVWQKIYKLIINFIQILKNKFGKE